MRKYREYRYDHDELRTKVTLTDFYAKRLNNLEIPYGSIANAYLMGAPVHNEERANLRERIKLSTRKLEQRARKFTSLRPESFWGSTARKMAEPEPSLQVRLWQLTSHLFTRQSPCVLQVPEWEEDIGAYVDAFDRLNGLKATP